MVYERLLVPVDRNETTVRAVRWGLDLAERLDVEVGLLHVVEGESRGLSLLSGSNTAATSDPEAAFPDGVDRLVADAGERVSRHVATGVPQQEILRFATDNDADLIVMGQDTKTGVRNHLFDSVADKVIHGAGVPVLAIPEMDDVRCQFDQLLLPISGRITDDAAVEHAAAVANEFEMSIHVVNVVDVQREAGPFNAGGVSKAFIQRMKRDAEPAIEQAIERLTDAGAKSEFERAVVHGALHEALDEYIVSNDIDLVVAGQFGTSRVARRVLGHVTEHVLQTVDVPVLVVSSQS